MIDYRKGFELTHENIHNMKLGDAIIPTPWDWDDDTDDEFPTSLRGKIVKVDDSGRLKLVAVDVDGKLAILYLNSSEEVFKNLCSNYDRKYFTGEKRHDVFVEEAEIDAEHRASWYELVKQYKEFFTEPYGNQVDELSAYNE